MRLPFTVRHKGQVIDLLDFEKPKQPYYVLESVT
jgi:pSer/pThr/pTyr-binding forkhead associated (FHA) protein